VRVVVAEAGIITVAALPASFRQHHRYQPMKPIRCIHAVVAATIVLAIYIGWYAYLRQTSYLIHRYTTGDGNTIVLGNFNPGIYLLASHPDEVRQSDGLGERTILTLFWPLRKLESWYNDMVYSYPSGMR
jgi:hypothetical protein